MAEPERRPEAPVAPEPAGNAEVIPFERSPLLHPRAGDALVLAGSAYPGERGRARRRGGWLRRLARALFW